MAAIGMLKVEGERIGRSGDACGQPDLHSGVVQVFRRVSVAAEEVVFQFAQQPVHQRHVLQMHKIAVTGSGRRRKFREELRMRPQQSGHHLLRQARQGSGGTWCAIQVHLYAIGPLAQADNEGDGRLADGVQ